METDICTRPNTNILKMSPQEVALATFCGKKHLKSRPRQWESGKPDGALLVIKNV